MTALEKEIQDLIDPVAYRFTSPIAARKAIYKVCKRYIEKGVKDFKGCGCPAPIEGTVSDWLKKKKASLK
jgi:hypothetical protein